jgi:hypothetical protein
MHRITVWMPVARLALELARNNSMMYRLQFAELSVYNIHDQREEILGMD